MTNDESANQYDHDHVVLWVNALRANRLDPAAVRDEVDRWSLGGVTQVCVGQHARTMPTDFVRAIVDQTLIATVRPT